MNIWNILVGFLLLLLGRRLFWLFVGVVGFLAGMNLATQYLSGQSQWVILVIALLAGLVGALLAVVFQRLAVAIAGYLAGSYLSVYILTTLGVDMAEFTWLVALVGGLIGGILAFLLFDWALVVLSSLVGASLIAPELTPDSETAALVFFVLALIGILVQAGLMRRYPPAARTTRRTWRRRRS